MRRKIRKEEEEEEAGRSEEEEMKLKSRKISRRFCYSPDVLAGEAPRSHHVARTKGSHVTIINSLSPNWLLFPPLQ